MSFDEDESTEYCKSIAIVAERAPFTLDDCDSHLVKIFHRFSARIANRTLLISKRGPLGTGVGQFQLGDQVFAVAGLDNLLILRGVGDYYVLVGHAYMDGLMKGEAWPENERDLQDIEIR
ncbi:hypothetical protein BKA63DRAFT_285676 [Paraphoma chrysanthemicola]|nr:hypothetical protein BKA63DRAFT_285676 [Paraphoma chrysanthemicola]